MDALARWPVVLDALREWRLSLPKEFRTVEAAGSLLGVSGAQMSRYEAGLRRVPPEKARAVSAITRIPLEVLRPDVWPPHPQRLEINEAPAS